MSEYKSKLQSNVNWLETFKMGRKAPVVANRIFKTLTEAQSYVKDLYDSATEGIRITVFDDPLDYNNGVYYVKSIGDGINDGELIQVGRGNAAWYKGNALNGNSSTKLIGGATPGDCYMNTDTLDVYILGNDGVWFKIGNMSVTKIDKSVPYYILSTNGIEHPAWDANIWIKGNSDGTNIPSNYDDYNAGQVYLWTRFYEKDEENEENYTAKYTVSLVYSELNLGLFKIN